MFSLHVQDRNEEPLSWTFDWPRLIWGPIVACAGYTSIHIASHIAFTKCFPSRMIALPRHHRLYVAEKVCSSLNGLIVGCIGAHLVWRKKTFESDPFQPYPALLDVAFTSHAGYSLFDTAHMLWVGIDGPAMYVHHILGGVGAILVMGIRHAAYWPTIFTITELAVVPVNLRWLLSRLSPRAMSIGTGDTRKPTRLSLYLSIVQLLFCLTFRTLIGPQCIWRLAMVWKRFQKLNYLIRYPTLINVGTLSVLNTYWTWKMIALVARLSCKGVNKFD